jgi:RNA polymerase sigma-70 factor (ECF subfamily)
LERALAALPDDQRLVVILSDVHGHSYAEIAEIAGVAIGTVKSRISRARARLRDTLREDPASRELFERFSRFPED